MKQKTELTSITVRGHRNFNRIIFLFVIIFSIFKSEYIFSQINIDDVSKIKIAYLPRYILPHNPITECMDVFGYMDVKDTIFTDKNFITEFINHVNCLEPLDKEIHYDLRIYCVVLFNNGNPHMAICLGEDRFTLFNGILMKDNKSFFDFINITLWGMKKPPLPYPTKNDSIF